MTDRAAPENGTTTIYRESDDERAERLRRSAERVGLHLTPDQEQALRAGLRKVD